jgi:hypothetical protein
MRMFSAMTLHIFQSQRTPELFGFTANYWGENLPPTDGPWERVGDAIPLGATMASTSPEIAQQIERNGYALVKGHSASQPHLHRGDSKP